MASADVQEPASHFSEGQADKASPFPDYFLDPNVVTKDQAAWRLGKAPDYSNTRRVFAESKRMNHSYGSLANMVENLVKNWEIEASFKTDVKDWRTVDPENFTFAINGGPPQDAAHVAKVGTYNAIITPNAYYSPEHFDLARSHKTFKRMMPAFAWEVLEVYSGLPRAVFRWRHWGQMKSDYVGRNDEGEEVTFKAHGGLVDIQGVTVATLNDKFQVVALETWFDPVEMFRQFTPKHIKVDGKSVDDAAAAEKVRGKQGVQAVQALVEQTDQTHLAKTYEVEIMNPKSGKSGISAHEEELVSEITTGLQETTGSGGCPFLASQAN